MNEEHLIVVNTTVLVYAWSEDAIQKAHAKAKGLFEDGFNLRDEKPFGNRLVTNVVTCLANGMYCFFVAPNGSFKGAMIANKTDNIREVFMEWLESSGCHYDTYQSNAYTHVPRQ